MATWDALTFQWRRDGADDTPVMRSKTTVDQNASFSKSKGAEHEPQVIAADRFPPMNEWLMYGSFAGWPGVLLFSLAVLFPFFIKQVHQRFFWIVLNVIIVFSYLFDMALEVQYGVFLYSFILLWWYKWFKAE